MALKTVFIDGQAGTTGLSIAARLRNLPGVALLELAQPDRKHPAARAEAMRAADLTILCLPDAQAREAVALAGPHARVLDASTAHRTQAGWVYGFAELAPEQPARIAAAARVANPGCYATGAIALLRPLIQAGLIAADALLSIHATSGYSGGGNAMIAAHEADGGPAFALYGLDLAHKHLAEITAHAGLARSPVFVPAVAHRRQGMLVCIPLHRDLLPKDATTQRLFDALAAHYDGAGEVRVVTPRGDHRLELDALAGSDRMEVTVFANPAIGQAVLVACFDNLGKGAGGAAVQNLKLMLGLPA